MDVLIGQVCVSCRLCVNTSFDTVSNAVVIFKLHSLTALDYVRSNVVVCGYLSNIVCLYD